jgi:hypothetical protein
MPRTNATPKVITSPTHRTVGQLPTGDRGRRIIARNGSRLPAIHSDDRTLADDDAESEFTRIRAAAAVSFGD